MIVEPFDPKNADVDLDTTGTSTVRDLQFEQSARDRSDEMIDEWGRQSFPASDPPSNW